VVQSSTEWGLQSPAASAATAQLVLLGHERVHLQQLRVEEQVARQVLGHVLGGVVAQALLAVLAGRLADFADPVRGTFRRQREASQVSTIMIVPMAERVPSSLPVITMPAALL
jgi:hypothetical protein